MKKSPRNAKPGNMRTRVFVVPEADGWSIRKSGADGASGIYATKTEALRAARDHLRASSGGEVTIYGRDGRIRGVDTYTLGSRAFGRVSAIEGLSLTGEMKRELQSFDRQNLSPAERRRRLIAKYSR